MSIYTAYEMRAEVNIVNRNYTTDYHEYYDYNNRRAATHSMVGGKKNPFWKRLKKFMLNSTEHELYPAHKC